MSATGLLSFLRGTVFVGLTASMVYLYCASVERAMPVLRGSPPEFVLLPMTVISGVVAAFVFPVLCRQRQRLGQASTLYIGFVLCMLLWAGYAWIAGGDGGLWLVPSSLFFGHLLGLPLFLIVLVVFLTVGRPLLIPRNGGR